MEKQFLYLKFSVIVEIIHLNRVKKNKCGNWEIAELDRKMNAKLRDDKMKAGSV